MPNTINRDTFRRYVALAHAEAANAQRMMIEGITATDGYPQIENRIIADAVTQLEKAAHMLRSALARVEDQQEGGAA